MFTFSFYFFIEAGRLCLRSHVPFPFLRIILPLNSRQRQANTSSTNLKVSILMWVMRIWLLQQSCPVNNFCLFPPQWWEVSGSFSRKELKLTANLAVKRSSNSIPNSFLCDPRSSFPPSVSLSSVHTLRSKALVLKEVPHGLPAHAADLGFFQAGKLTLAL